MGALIFGTAQFGSGYGLSNRRGMLDEASVHELVRVAWEHGIRTFDTAQGYGQSEDLLGRAIRALGIQKEVRIITKLDRSVDARDARAVVRASEASCERLGVSRLAAILLHSERLLDQWNEGIGDALRAAVAADHTERVGVSVYDPQRALQALAADGLDVLQLPTNVVDQRFVHADVFERAAQRNASCVIRSVYLQGLLLMETDAVPKDMTFAIPTLEILAQLATEFGVSRRSLAIGYIRTAFPDADVIVGMEHPTQVQDNALLWSACMLEREQLDRVRTAFAVVDHRVCNPLLWPMYSHLTA